MSPATPADSRPPDPDRAPATARSATGLARSAGGIGAATLASRVLGLVRDQVLAALFGAGDAMDAFYVAFRIPNLLRDLFAEGAMSAAFVPTFTRRLTTGGRESAWQLGRQVVTALFLVTGAIAGVGMVFAEPLARLFAADYADVPGKLALTSSLTLYMFPFLPMIAVAAAFMGMLNSLNRFMTPAFSPAMFNVAMIVCVVAVAPLAPALGIEPIAAVAIGVLAGGLVQAAVQWPALRREGFSYRPALDPRDEGLRDILILMGPGIVGLAATQVNLFVNTVLATGEGTGAVSWLSYAFRLMYLPIGLFGVSIATAALPSLSRHAATDATADMRTTLSSGLRLMLMLNVPATVGLVALASPIIELIFQYGAFSAADTAATAAALIFYAPGLIGYSAVKLAVPSFYALRDSRTPVVVSVATMVLNIVLNIALVRAMGYTGLALGTAIAALANAAALLWLLGRRLEGLDGRRIWVSFARILVASAIMAVAAVAAEQGLHLIAGEGVWARLVRVFGGMGAGVLTLVVAARLLRVEELDEAIGRVRARLRGRQPR